MSYQPKHLKAYKRPDCYIGETFPDYWTIYGRHRDSDTAERSNFRSIIRLLGGENDDPDSEVYGVMIDRASHWAVGWLETLRIHVQAPEALIIRADDLIGKLEDYPLIDDDDHSELEWAEVTEYWERMSVSERVGYLQDARQNIFAARRSEFPPDDNGYLFDRFRG